MTRRSTVRESVAGGLALILVAGLCLLLKRSLASALADPRSSASADWYLWVLVGVGLFHLFEGLFGLGGPNLRVVTRFVKSWRIRHAAWPDALSEPARGPAEWALPVRCRCGEVRPDIAPRCGGCGRN